MFIATYPGLSTSRGVRQGDALTPIISIIIRTDLAGGIDIDGEPLSLTDQRFAVDVVNDPKDLNMYIQNMKQLMMLIKYLPSNCSVWILLFNLYEFVVKDTWS